MARNYSTAFTETIENITLGAGVVIKNIDEVDEEIVAVTTDGVQLIVERNWVQIPLDDVPAGAIGTSRISGYKVNLKFSTYNTGLEKLALALPEAKFDSVGRTLKIGSMTDISADKYLTNIACLGPDSAGVSKMIKLFNALNVGNITIHRKPADESDGGGAKLEFDFQAHFDPSKITEVNGKIDYGDLLEIAEVEVLP